MVKVMVPATSANIGPGFDSLGIAFNIYNEFEFSEIEEGIEFHGFKREFCNKENIVYRAMELCFKRANYKIKGMKIGLLKENIPISRGLGSSSSCIVAGLIGANCIMGNPFKIEELFKLGVEFEGHPDNIAPAFFGGMVISVMEDNEVIYNNIPIKDGIKFISLIPSFELSTSSAREVLPKEIPFKDAVYNISRVSLMISAFISGKFELLKYACKDTLHEKYRSPLIKNYDLVYNKLLELDALCCFLSGAGPTIMGIIKDSNKDIIKELEGFFKEKNLDWTIKELTVDNLGAQLIKGESNEK